MAESETVLVPTEDTKKSPGVHYVTSKAEELDFCYSLPDKIFQLSLGKNAHFSNAMFNGDFSMTLQEGQDAKVDYIARMLGIKEGSKVIDLGCGWGGILQRLKQVHKADVTGVVLAQAQYRHCLETGLNVHLGDMREVKPADYGTFDAVVASGSFDHVLSYEDFLAGKKEEVYTNWFDMVAELLPIGGRYYMQTMTFGRKIIPRETWDINADRDSDEFTMALMVKQFPMSWLPYMDQEVIDYAGKRFKLIEHWSGRTDYVETNRRWTEAYKKFSFKKYWYFMKFIPKYLTDKEFRHVASFLKYAPNRRCFERELFDHFRYVFERVN